MALEDIFKRIDLDVQKQVEAALNQAKAGEKEALAAAQGEAESAAGAIVEEAHALSRKEKTKVLSEASMKARLIVLKEKQSLLDEAFAAAAEALAKMDRESYLALLKSMLMKTVERGDEEITVSKSDERIDEGFIEEVNRSIKGGRLRLVRVDEYLGGGFILRSDRMLVNMTFPSVIEEMKPRLVSEVARILFA